MLNTNDFGEEYELEWPPALFKEEAEAIAAVSATQFDEFADLLLTEAFIESAPVEEFRQRTMWQGWGTSPAVEPTGKAFFLELARNADSLPKVAAARPYWIQKKPGSIAPQRAPRSSFREDWLRVVADLISAGYFALAAEEACVDGLSEVDVAENLSRQVERRTGIPDLWPFPNEANGGNEDLLLTLVEVLHDLAARPRRRTFHEFGQCGWHHHDPAKKAGRSLYRWKVNDLLQRHNYDLRLADEGEDVGRLVRHLTDPRAELIVEVIKSEDGPTKASTEHAIALFRKRGATREDKRSACAALALVLEDRRRLLKTSLLKKDEGMLFQIANEFDVRHRDGKQYSDLGDEFQDWVFWMYLATVELTNRLTSRGNLS
ncbi:hypothetical protein ACHMXB_21325 (plasmid) [Arthrobacter sp. UC242_113]|uniref:hypothetical protein n=1 Tax=Arthrobacter sp. UC242_113 TaxID=3374550 RepID=UPI0037564762